MKTIIRLLLALICSFFTVAGLAICFIYANRGFDYLGMAGGGYFGALAMFCYALMGLIFTGVFGYLAWRILTPRLCLVQALICLLVSTAGHICNQQHEPREHTLSPQQPHELDGLTLTILETPAQDIAESIRLQTKDRKGQHDQILIKGQTFDHKGYYITYSDVKDAAFQLKSHYQPGIFWMQVGNIGSLASIIACIVLLFTLRKKKPSSSQPSSPASE